MHCRVVFVSINSCMLHWRTHSTVNKKRLVSSSIVVSFSFLQIQACCIGRQTAKSVRKGLCRHALSCPLHFYKFRHAALADRQQINKKGLVSSCIVVSLSFLQIQACCIGRYPVKPIRKGLCRHALSCRFRF